MHPPIDLSKAGLGNFQRRRSRWVEGLWLLAEFFLIENPLQISSGVRLAVLRLFGARIGRGCYMRPRVRVKFPWRLTLGQNCWIGEGVWLHNQDDLTIGSNVALSQETFITTGSHDAHGTMDLLTKPVRVEDGVWLTARCIVLQGVVIGQNAIVTPGSVVHKSLDPNGVYGGNPAKFIRARFPEEDGRAAESEDASPTGVK